MNIGYDILEFPCDTFPAHSSARNATHTLKTPCHETLFSGLKIIIDFWSEEQEDKRRAIMNNYIRLYIRQELLLICWTIMNNQLQCCS
jgi:hypothetical protein